MPHETQFTREYRDRRVISELLEFTQMSLRNTPWYHFKKIVELNGTIKLLRKILYN